MNSEDILLKEYESLREDNHQRVNHFWIVVGIYMSVNTAIFGAIVVAYISGTIHHGVNIWLVFSLVSILGGSAIHILYRLVQYQRRIDFVVYSNYERMREIESALHIWGNWRIHGIDQWMEKGQDFTNDIADDMKAELLKYHSANYWQKWKTSKGYMKPIGAENAKLMMYSIMGLWIVFIIASLIFSIIACQR